MAKSKLENLPKKVITDPLEDEILETEILTEEEKITGVEAKTLITQKIKYENPQIIYKVTNLTLNNAPIFVKGNLIETFIGSTNQIARKKLISGEKKVITKDVNGNEIYKIEVVE